MKRHCIFVISKPPIPMPNKLITLHWNELLHYLKNNRKQFDIEVESVRNQADKETVIILKDTYLDAVTYAPKTDFLRLYGIESFENWVKIQYKSHQPTL